MDYLTLFSLLFHFPSFPFDFRPWSLFLAFPLELILVNPSPSFFFPAPSSSISIAIPASASSYPWPVAEDIHTLSPLQAPLLSYLSSSPFLRPQKARPTTLSLAPLPLVVSGTTGSKAYTHSPRIVEVSSLLLALVTTTFLPLCVAGHRLYPQIPHAWQYISMPATVI